MTSNFSAFIESAKVFTAAVERGVARVLDADGAVVAHGHQRHRPRNVLLKPGHILTGVLVDPDDSVKDPVRVEEEVTVDGQVKGVLRRGQREDDPLPCVDVHPLDLVETSVGPVELSSVGVDGEGVRHPDVVLHDALETEAGKPSSLNFRSLRIPICEVDSSLARINIDSSGPIVLLETNDGFGLEVLGR